MDFTKLLEGLSQKRSKTQKPSHCMNPRMRDIRTVIQMWARGAGQWVLLMGQGLRGAGSP